MFDLRDFAGARGSARIPVSRALLNRLAAQALAGGGTPVRSLDIQPRAGDRVDVVVTVSWPFVPTFTASFTIDRQPEFPGSPVLVLRWSLLGAVGAIASRVIQAFDRLPPGVRLDGDRIFLEIPTLAARTPAAHMVDHVSALELHTLDDLVVVEVELAIAE